MIKALFYISLSQKSINALIEIFKKIYYTFELWLPMIEYIFVLFTIHRERYLLKMQLFHDCNVLTLLQSSGITDRKRICNLRVCLMKCIKNIYV